MKTISKFLVSTVILGMLLVGCGKKAGSGGVTDAGVLASIPDSSFGFLTLSTQGPAYTEYRAKTTGAMRAAEWEKISSVLAAKPELKPLLTGLEKAGVLGSEGLVSEVVANVVTFAYSEEKATEAAFGLFVTAAPNGGSLRDRLSSLEEVLKNQGLTPQKMDFSGVPGFSVEVKADLGGQPVSKVVYAAAQPDKMAAATTKSGVEALFSKVPTEGRPRIVESPLFKRADVDFKTDRQISFGYVDVAKLIGFVNASMPEAERAQANLGAMPVEALALSGEYDGSMSAKANVVISPKSPDQERMLKAFDVASDNFAHLSLAKSPLLAISFDGNTLTKALELALTEAPAENIAIVKQAEFLKSVTGMAIGVYPPGPGAVFPDLLLMLASKDPQSLMLKLKDTVLIELVSSIMPGARWQEKESNGAKYWTLPSPMGASPTIGVAGQFVVFSAVGSTYANGVRAVADKAESLGGSVPSELQAILLERNSNGVVYFDMPGVAAALEQAQGMAAVLGGQDMVPGEAVESLKRLGQVAGNTKYSGGLMKFRYSSKVQ